jgi:hypothetical protein
MASIAVTTAGSVHVVESIEQITLPVGEAILAGDTLSIDANGRFMKADADGAGALALPRAVATRSCAIYEALTGIKKGVMTGWTLTAVAYSAAILASDTAGEITATSSESNGGSADVAIGFVVPIWDHLIGGSPEKAICINL